MRALGIDIGGTKIAAAVVDDSGTLIGRHQVATPRTADGDAVFAAVVEAGDGALHAAGYPASRGGVAVTGYDGLRANAGPAAVSHIPTEAGHEPIAGVGVATAGPIDEIAGTVSPVNIGGWRDYPLRDRLAAHYAALSVPIRLFGDGIAIAIAEHWLGAGRGADNMLGMVVSTGVGGGLVLGGRVLFGAGGNAGHIGHMSIDAEGPACVCGGVGCLEALASGTSIATWYAEQRGAEKRDGGRYLATQPDGFAVAPTAARVAEFARAGDEVALAAFRRSANALGQALAGTVTLLDLDRVVIGGGVAHAWDLLEKPLAAAYRMYAALEFAATPRVVRAELGANTGVLGAAAVVLQPDRYWPAR